MSTVTAEAAYLFLGEGKPSLAIDCVVDARCGLVRDDTAAEAIIPAIGSIDSFSVILWIVEFLAIDLVVGAVDDKGIIECDIVRVIIDWWFWISCGDSR